MPHSFSSASGIPPLPRNNGRRQVCPVPPHEPHSGAQTTHPLHDAANLRPPLATRQDPAGPLGALDGSRPTSRRVVAGWKPACNEIAGHPAACGTGYVVMLNRPAACLDPSMNVRSPTQLRVQFGAVGFLACCTVLPRTTTPWKTAVSSHRRIVASTHRHIAEREYGG